MEALVIAKLKIHQCIRMTDLPNLMLTKVSRYTVVPMLLMAFKEGLDMENFEILGAF